MELPTRRRNPLTNKWVLLSPQRMSRPWTGKIETIQEESQPSYDKECFLCPNNIRTSNVQNPNYTGTHVFRNDFAALLATHGNKGHIDPLFSEQDVSGNCEVICYSPVHNKNLMHLSIDEIVEILRTFQKRSEDIGSHKDIEYVQIFESRGKEVGNSNLHPHAQIWAQSVIPTFVQEEIDAQRTYFEIHKSSMLLDYWKEEVEKGERVVYENNTFCVLVPFWAEWPYEILVLPKFQIESLSQLSNDQLVDLAKCYSKIAVAYAKLFHRPSYGSPYMMGIHQRPTNGSEYPGFQMHIHFLSPMLTPERQKFQAGYEKFAEPQRDLTPELAATQLRDFFE